jgi:dienelactone hydrolase
VAVLVAALAAGCGGHRQGLRLSVTPVSALADTPFTVRVTGVTPHAQVTLTVLDRTRRGRLGRATLTWRADAHGQVALRNQYLVARLRPLRKPIPGDYLTSDVTVVAHAGSASAAVHVRSVVRPASLTFTRDRPRRVGFYGEWITPRGARRHTAVLLLGGSDGGLANGLAADMLAARGYPVLRLAYFHEPGLPKHLAGIPLEYFRRALEWMRARPEVDPQRIVTFGVSRGGELSLLLASTFPDLIHGAVDYVGGDAAGRGWTYRRKVVTGSIPLDRISGPVFAVGGGKDMLTAFVLIEHVAHVLHGHDRRDVTLIYPRAGHLVGLAVPNQPELTTVGELYLNGRTDFGGSPAADEAAREDSWPKLLRFLASI